MINLIFMTCFIIFAFLTAVSMLIAGYIFSYKSPDRVKSSTYECGLSPKTSAKVNFHIRYFNYLIMFVIFDLSVIFLYPLFSDGIGYIKSHWGVLISFLVILLCGIFAAINRGFIGSVKK